MKSPKQIRALAKGLTRKNPRGRAIAGDYDALYKQAARKALQYTKRADRLKDPQKRYTWYLQAAIQYRAAAYYCKNAGETARAKRYTALSAKARQKAHRVAAGSRENPGGSFKACQRMVEKSYAKRGKAVDSGAVCAAIGRRTYGKKAFAAMSVAGRKAAARRRRAHRRRNPVTASTPKHEWQAAIYMKDNSLVFERLRNQAHHGAMQNEAERIAERHYPGKYRHVMLVNRTIG